MTDYFVVRCELCLGEDGQPWLRREGCRECAVDVRARHLQAFPSHVVTVQSPPSERTTDNVQRLLRRVGGW